MITGIGNNKNFEKRELASIPDWPDFTRRNLVDLNNELLDFSNKFNDYLNDHFPFRNALFSLYKNIKIKVFNTSPIPGKVILGKNGWMYLGEDFGEVTRETMGISAFSPLEIKKCVENIFRYDTLLDHAGISFYFTIAPDKQSVYGQFLSIVKSPRPTKLEQLKLSLEKKNIKLIDLKENFDKWPNKTLYYKKDSHWNQFGAFVGYQTLFEEIRSDFPQVPVKEFDDYTLNTQNKFDFDLATMLRMDGLEKTVIFIPKHHDSVQTIEKRLPVPEKYPHNPNDYERRYICNGKPLKALIFSDSFFIEFIPFVTGSFGETVIVWDRISTKVIAKEKPDIVICESVEREIDKFLKFE